MKRSACVGKFQCMGLKWGRTSSTASLLNLSPVYILVSKKVVSVSKGKFLTKI